MNARENLLAAGVNYSNCAGKVQLGCLDAEVPTGRESELLIAFGIASDWSRRAAALQPLVYSGKRMNKSRYSLSVTEIIRFTMAWSALNALFARPSVLRLLGRRTQGSELERFNILVQNSGVAEQRKLRYEGILQEILATDVVTTVPGHPPKSTVPTVQILHEKYTPISYQSMGVGRRMQESISNGSTENLDLATLIYAMRNWSVHGGVVASSFRSVPRFKSYIGTVVKAVADIHVGVSENLHNSI